MSTIIFRTNAGRLSGLGHLVRCIHLADELLQRGSDVLFVMDTIEPGVTGFLKQHDSIALYDAPQEGLDPEADVGRFLELIGERWPAWVILDDYRLGESWEKRIKEAGYSLCVIDDLLRPHLCDMLIDNRWRGQETQHSYDGLVPTQAKKLLGPGYTMLSPLYRQHPVKGDRDEVFTIMLSLGGGGDLRALETTIDTLLAHQSDFMRPIRLFVVLGPLVSNDADFATRYQVNDKLVLLQGKTDLYPYLSQTDLYIGAAGSTLYQLLVLKVPALTFALSPSQQTEHAHLEDIGHYFHIEEWTERDAELLPVFVDTVICHYGRVAELCSHPRVKVDPRGAEHVAVALLGSEQPPWQATVEEVEPPAQWHELSVEHRLRAVRDSDINHYLSSRNLKANRNNMIGDAEIPRLGHYAWWFNTQRESFLLMRGELPSLYIWHELKHYGTNEYLIGGWFVCNEDTQFDDALLALHWQLSYCDKQFPGIPWLAVIQRQNRYVKLMNDYVGFKEVEPGEAYGDAIADIFTNADHESFYYVVRDALE